VRSGGNDCAIQSLTQRGEGARRAQRRAHRPREQLEIGTMTRALAVIVFVLFALPSGAEDQHVRIPDACRELANRAGLPLTLTPWQAARAVAYLRLMSSDDPAVRRCRQAMSYGQRPSVERLN
jgi:hypothetical protein